MPAIACFSLSWIAPSWQRYDSHADAWIAYMLKESRSSTSAYSTFASAIPALLLTKRALRRCAVARAWRCGMSWSL